jgi:F420-dependent oxidoreductase-like protein
MKIGLTGRGATADDLVAHAKWAEQQGFSSVWYASPMAGDPLVAMAIAGRETSRIELGTAVLQTYPCHPVLQANRVAAAANAMGRTGFTLGIGPSHERWITSLYGRPFDRPASSTAEYLRILAPVLRGEGVDFDGADWSSHSPPGGGARNRVPILVSGMGPRMVEIAGTLADGIIAYLASPRLLETRIVPQLKAAAEEAGRPAPRVVAGLPVAVHHDVDEARAAAARWSAMFGDLPVYKRVLNEGGYDSYPDIALVGDGKAVASKVRALANSGVTDVWAAVFPVGPDADASIRRTTDLLETLL